MSFLSKPLPSSYPEDIDETKPIQEVSDERFEELVDYALSTIPSDVTKHFHNLAIVSEPYGGSPNLLGLFQGVPLPKKLNNTGGMLPDKITLYKNTIKNYSNNEKQLYEQINITLKHEIGHYFGLDHDVLDKYGY